MSKQKELNNKIEKLEINEIKLWLDYLSKCEYLSLYKYIFCFLILVYL